MELSRISFLGLEALVCHISGIDGIVAPHRELPTLEIPLFICSLMPKTFMVAPLFSSTTTFSRYVTYLHRIGIDWICLCVLGFGHEQLLPDVPLVVG